MILRLTGALLGPLLFMFSCNAQAPKPVAAKPALAVPGQPAPPAGASTKPVKVDSATLEKGKKLYMANCLQCHNKDPNLKGAIGPENVDAPLSVMTSKIMTGKYPDPLPPGFVPKRKSRAMRAIPKLKNDIPAIHAWVQSVKKKK